MIENGLKYYDSRTATEEEFTENLTVSSLSGSEQQTKGGPILFRKGKKIYTDPSDLHNLIVGNTGSMKTLRFVLPLIYSSAMAAESMIIVDPKGELVRKMHSFLKEKGYQISVLNWRNPRLSPDSWNPMPFCRCATSSPGAGEVFPQRESPWQNQKVCVDCQGLPLWGRWMRTQ